MDDGGESKDAVVGRDGRGDALQDDRFVLVSVDRGSETAYDWVCNFLRNAGKSLGTFRFFGKRPPSAIRQNSITVFVFDFQNVIGYGHLRDGSLGICVADGYHGNGIGTRIMERLLSFAGDSVVQLVVDRDNLLARRFYKRFGFKVLGDAGDMVLMELAHV